jgi:rhodanese-related sulfurtransferase
MTLYDSAVPNPAGFRDVSVEQVATLSPSSAVRLIDVRETDEWLGELGHAETALHVPLATVAQAAAAWPKEAETVLICRSGNRSGKAALLLRELGFSRVMNMVGGMLAWDAAKLPVVRGR